MLKFTEPQAVIYLWIAHDAILECFMQLLEAKTMRYIFQNNYHLCNEISDRVVHHFVHCMETHGRRVPYLRFLQTIVKADGKYVKKCQDKVMTEVRQET